jgi:hypothetical protein
MSYLLVVILDGIVVILALILNPLAKRRRAKIEAEAAQNGLTVTHSRTRNDIVPPAPFSAATTIVEGEVMTEKQERKRDNNIAAGETTVDAETGSGRECKSEEEGISSGGADTVRT